MIGLIGWWRRVENEKSKETKKTGTPDGWKLETDARINFVKQFFPDLSESPGGTTKLNKSDSCIKKKKNQENDKIVSRSTQVVHSNRGLHCDGAEQNYPNFDNLTPGK